MPELVGDDGMEVFLPATWSWPSEEHDPSGMPGQSGAPGVTDGFTRRRHVGQGRLPSTCSAPPLPLRVWRLRHLRIAGRFLACDTQGMKELLVLVGVVVAACGGEAIIDPPLGAGGSNIAGGTGAGTPSSSGVVGPTSSTSTGGGPFEEACVAACTAAEGCLEASVDQCISECVDGPMECADAYLSYLNCSASSAGPDCGYSPFACDEEALGLLNCQGVGGFGVSCTAGCSCTLDIEGYSLASNCNGESCTCFDGDRALGRCTNAPPIGGCTDFGSCCLSFWFILGG